MNSPDGRRSLLAWGVRRWLLVLTALAALTLSACGGEATEGELTDLRLVGVDFELDSIIITNSGVNDVRTSGLWAYQDGEISEFNIFTIEPRTEILFRVDDLGGVEPSGGEIGLYLSDSFSDPEAMIEYVAWGESGHSRMDVALDAGEWADGSVETSSDSLVIIRADQSLNGPGAWSASDVIP